MFDLVPEILFYVFAAFVAIQMAYYWILFSRMAFYRHPGKIKEKPPVSVIIAASNEYYNLAENLPVLFNQDYPEFEVLVVNDPVRLPRELGVVLGEDGDVGSIL